MAIIKRHFLTTAIAVAVFVCSYVFLDAYHAFSITFNVAASVTVGAGLWACLNFADFPAMARAPEFVPAGYADHTNKRQAMAEGVTSTGWFLRGKRVAVGFWRAAPA